MLVGISGKKFVGKDTVGNMLETAAMDLSVERAAFADPLKKVGSNISGIPLQWFYDPDRKEQLHACCGKSPRMVMEEANAIFKECWGDDVFVVPVDRLFRASSADLFLVTDVRFEVEADWVRSAGGVVIHVLRDTGYTSSAKSEQGVAVRSSDFVIRNDSSLVDLAEKVLAVFNTLSARKCLTKTENLLI